MKNYTSSQLRNWSYRIRSAAGWRCQMCQREHKATKERRCEAHHIWPKAKYPALALDYRNGICLCQRCHRQVVHKTWENWDIFVDMFMYLATETFLHNGDYFTVSLAELRRKRRGQ